MEITILKHVKKEFTTIISLQSDDSDKMILNVIDSIESVINKTFRIDEKRKSFYILEIPTKDSDTTLLKILKLFRNNNWNILTSNCFESLPLNSMVNTIETTFFLEYIINHNNHINYNERKSEISYEKISAESRRRSSIGASSYNIHTQPLENHVNKQLAVTNSDHTLHDQESTHTPKIQNNTNTGVGMSVTTGKLYQKFLSRRASLTKSQVDQPQTNSTSNNDITSRSDHHYHHNNSSENREVTSSPHSISSINVANIETKQDRTKSNSTYVSEDSHPLAADTSLPIKNHSNATYIPSSYSSSPITSATTNTSKNIVHSKQPTVELTNQVAKTYTTVDTIKRPSTSSSVHVTTDTTRRPSITSETPTDDLKAKRPSGSWIKHDSSNVSSNTSTSLHSSNVSSNTSTSLHSSSNNNSNIVTSTAAVVSTPSAASKLLQSASDDDDNTNTTTSDNDLIRSAVNPLSAQSIYKSRHTTEPIQKDQHEVEKINHFSKLGSAFLNGNSLQKKGGPGRGLGKSI